MLSKLIKLCRFSKDSVDEGHFNVQQIEYQGKTVDVAVVMPYGMHANIPEGYLGLLLKLSGQEGNRLVIPMSPGERPRLEPGEVAFFHPVNGAKVTFKNNGKIKVITDGDVDVEAGGDVSVKATNISLEGDVTIDGKLHVKDDCIFDGGMANNGINVGQPHKHPETHGVTGSAID